MATMVPKTQPSVTHASTDLWLYISSFGLETWKHTFHGKGPWTKHSTCSFVERQKKGLDLASLLWIVGKSIPHLSLLVIFVVFFFPSLASNKEAGTTLCPAMYWPVFLMFRQICFFTGTSCIQFATLKHLLRGLHKSTLLSRFVVVYKALKSHRCHWTTLKT